MCFTCTLRFSSRSKMESRSLERWDCAELAAVVENPNLCTCSGFLGILVGRRGVVAAPTRAGVLPASLTPGPFLGVGTGRLDGAVAGTAAAFSWKDDLTTP